MKTGFFKSLFDGRDWIAFLVSVLLAFAVWLIHNLSLTYSNFVERSIAVRCDIPGHANQASAPVEVAARCDLSGYSLMMLRMLRLSSPKEQTIAPEDMHPYRGDLFYMTSSDLTKYYHSLFGEATKLEYFVNDTLVFQFPSVNFKKVPVNAIQSISYKSQYMPTGPLKLEPDSVLVYGETPLLESINSINTDIIRESGASSDVYGEVDLKPVDGMRMSATKVKYTQAVKRYVETKFTLPVTVTNAPDSIMMQVIPGSAVLTVRSSFPSNDDFSQIQVCIDYNDFVSSIQGTCVGNVCGLPPEIISYSVSPQVFNCFEQLQER